MKSLYSDLPRTFVLLTCCCFLIAACLASPLAQGAKDKDAKVSSGEADAVKKIESASDLAAKLKLAGEFTKKFAKSSLRPRVAQYLAEEVSTVNDPGQRLSYIESYNKLFTEASEQELLAPTLVDVYVRSSRVDDAFKLAAGALAKNPDDVTMLTQLGVAAADQAQRGNLKYAAEGRQYSLKAIELIEADKKPAALAAAFWSDFKPRWLPKLYQSLGVIALSSGDATEAQTRVQQSAALSPTDPYNYVILGVIANDVYQALAKEYGAARAGAEKDAILKKVEAQLDQVIDIYAHAVALTDGKPEFKQLHDQFLPDLENYYKFRKGSLDGLPQLIEKLKKTP